MRSIRIRITALASVVIAVVMVVSALAVVVLQSRQLTASIDESLRMEANAVMSSGDPDLTLASEGTLVQVVDANGVVTAANDSRITGEALAPEPTVEAITEQRTALDDDPYRVLSRIVPDRAATLHVAINAEDVGESAQALMAGLAVAVPLAVLVLAGLVWWMVGRTLRPVEAIRREVATISGEPGRRVPVPSTDDEVSRLAGTMNEMLERIDDAIERQRRFVADASHELRTPLTRIRTQLEVADPHDHADLMAANRGVLDDTQELQDLIDDLLFLAQADARAVSIPDDPVDLDDVALAAVAVEPSRDIAVDTTGIEAAPTVGHGGLLRRVASNLIDNAYRHAATRVWVRTSESGSGAELVVGNDGPPIPDEMRQLIFQRFTRLDEARSRDEGGSGLGLSIAQEIIERHGGSIMLRSDVDGTEFVVQLPNHAPPS